MSEDFLYHEISEKRYHRIMQLDGVRTTIAENRFEIVVEPKGDIYDVAVVALLKDWIKWRREKMEKEDPVCAASSEKA